MSEPAWFPGEIGATNVGRFMAEHGIDEFETLRARSIAEPEWFWDATVKFLGIVFDEAYTDVLDNSAGFAWSTWFTGGKLNVAKNLLRHDPGRPAIVWEGEDGAQRTWTYGELAAQAGALADRLEREGVSHGDVVGVFMPMLPETVAALIGIVSIGAVFLPLFSGYGADAVATRLGDAGAVALITADGTYRRGKVIDMAAVADQAVAISPTVKTVVTVNRLGRRGNWPEPSPNWPDPSPNPTDPSPNPTDPSPNPTDPSPNWSRYKHENTTESRPVAGFGAGFGAGFAGFGGEATPVDAEHPLFIAYTSGTTGRPKGTIAVHGGFLVKVAEEVAFQFDCRREDTLFWFTDMGWIMGPWEVIGTLANGARLALYEGAPDWPEPDRLWSYLARHEVTILGISPTLIRSLMSHGDALVKQHDLSKLRILGSTGEPWNEDPWRWYFEVVGGGRCPVINISGGTEVGACFLSPHPVEPIKPMSLGGPCLGLAVDVYDDDARPLREAVGELVCTKPWPGMTRGIYKDPQRYIETYWSRWPDVWVHGDWASIDAEGDWFLHGRSDDTIKVAGKRLGPAEVETVLVGHDSVVEAAAVGIPDEVKGEALWCFVVLGDGAQPSDGLRMELVKLVGDKLGKSFAPSAVRFTSALPKTRNAKVLRRAVRAVVTGKDPGDMTSLEDPSTLDAIRVAV